MKALILRMGTTLAVWLAAAGPARADFAVSNLPQFVQDQAPAWLGQILTAILLLLSESFLNLLGLSST